MATSEQSEERPWPDEQDHKESDEANGTTASDKREHRAGCAVGTHKGVGAEGVGGL